MSLKRGTIRRLSDSRAPVRVLEIRAENAVSSFITTPRTYDDALSLPFPYFNLYAKNVSRLHQATLPNRAHSCNAAQLGEPFYFEVQVVDNKGVRRRFRAASTQSTTRIKPFVCSMPLRMENDWNRFQFDLRDMTSRAFGKAMTLEHCRCLRGAKECFLVQAQNLSALLAFKFILRSACTACLPASSHTPWNRSRRISSG